MSDLAGERPAAHALRYLGAACLGLVAAVLTGRAVAQSSVLVHPTSSGVLRALYVASLFAVGTFSWWRRPGGRLGPLLICVGVVYSLTSLNASADSIAFTVGMTIFAAYVVLLAFVYMSFPGGWLETRLERTAIAALGAVTVLLWIPILAVAHSLPTGGPFADCGKSCPPNAAQAIDAPSAGRVLDHAYELLSAAALVGVAVLILRRARSPDQLRRRAHGPLAVAFIVLIAGYLLYQAVTPSYPGTTQAFRIVLAIASLAAPAAVLVGQIWANVSITTSLGQIAMQVGSDSLGPARMQSLIGEALGDPTLTLALWQPENSRYVDVDGKPVVIPDNPRSRGVTHMERDGAPVAALFHAPELDVDPEVVEALAATSLLLLENARLVDELRASRARIVDAAENERLRLERDLHDGAQQRLMAIEIKLSLARDQVVDDDVATALDEIGADAKAATEELRALAHGIYPTVLRERGLADALRSAATTAPLPVAVADRGIGRCSPTVEAAVYFCCLEAIQNTVKHAGPRAHVSVTLARRDSLVDFEVSDDGLGTSSAGNSAGTGLTGMRDRIGAVGGVLEVVSSAGAGTTVRGTVPVGTQ